MLLADVLSRHRAVRVTRWPQAALCSDTVGLLVLSQKAQFSVGPQESGLLPAPVGLVGAEARVWAVQGRGHTDREADRFLGSLPWGREDKAYWQGT